MLEGTRTSYIVPGYTGYLICDLDISHTKCILTLSLLARKSQDMRFQDMLDMSVPLNQRTYMLRLLENLLMISLTEIISRDKIICQKINTFPVRLIHISLHHRCYKEQQLILWELIIEE